jgi:outer membrane protein
LTRAGTAPRVAKAAIGSLALLSWLLAASASAAAATQDRPRVLTLERALALALERNADLQSSNLQVSSAEADKLQARAAVLPRLDFNSSVNRIRNGGGEVTGSFVDPATGNTVPFQSPTQIFSSFAAGLSLQQVVFDGGKSWNNLQASKLALAAAREGSEEARLQTTFLVEQRFYELVRAQRQLRVLAEAATRSRDQAEATQRLFEAGRQTQADVYAARANRDNDEINRLGQEARVELARQDLAVAIGADPGEPIAIEEPPRLFEDPTPPPPAGDAVAKALSSRPSLKAFAHMGESQRRAADAASGDYWPAISVGVGFSRQTQDFGTFTSSPDKASTLSVGVTLTWNLFNGFATTAQVTKAQVQALQAENDLRDARRRIAVEVKKAVTQLAVARQLAQVATRSEENAREGLRLARTRQEVGAGTQLEVRDAELKLTQSQLARVAALVGGREAEAALRRAMGGS